MDPELKKIVTDMTMALDAWLDKPSPTTQKLAEFEVQATALKDDIGAKTVADLKKQLHQAVAASQRARLREAADAIAELCRDKGVILEAREPLKRRRKASKKREGGSDVGGG